MLFHYWKKKRRHVSVTLCLGKMPCLYTYSSVEKRSHFSRDGGKVAVAGGIHTAASCLNKEVTAGYPHCPEPRDLVHIPVSFHIFKFGAL